MPAVELAVDLQDLLPSPQALPPQWQDQGENDLGPCGLDHHPQSHGHSRHTPALPGHIAGAHLEEQWGL